MNGCRKDAEIIEQSTAFSFLRVDNDSVNFDEVNLIVIGKCFQFCF